MKKFKIKVHGTEYQVNINDIKNNIAHLTVNDIDFEVEVEGIATNPTRMSTTVNAPRPVMQTAAPVAKPAAAPTTAGDAKPLKSPLPGVILDVKVKEGDTVKAGQLAVIIEAMKMENNIDIDKSGVVEKVNVQKGSSVMEGDVLLTIK